MRSHLPRPVLDHLTQAARSLDEWLQAESYKVDKAIAIDSAAFDFGYIESPLLRALLCRAAPEVVPKPLTVEFFPNGGCELRSIHDGIERRFRFRAARRNAWGDLVVRTNSDSFLTHTLRDIRPDTLFGTEAPQCVLTTEQWVLAYILRPGTRTLLEISARLPVALLGNPPYRLLWGEVAPIPLGDLTPPSFPGREDDLPMDDDESGEETG